MTESIFVARNKDGEVWVHFTRPVLDFDGIFRDGGKTQICHILQEDLFPDIKAGECVEYKMFGKPYMSKTCGNCKYYKNGFCMRLEKYLSDDDTCGDWDEKKI